MYQRAQSIEGCNFEGTNAQKRNALRDYKCTEVWVTVPTCIHYRSPFTTYDGGSIIQAWHTGGFTMLLSSLTVGPAPGYFSFGEVQNVKEGCFRKWVSGHLLESKQSLCHAFSPLKLPQQEGAKPPLQLYSPSSGYEHIEAKQEEQFIW